MKLKVGGGIGEHGRNCFYIQHNDLSVIFDCGVMLGDKSPYPRLTSAQIAGSDYLFLSHSHQDHTGAYTWLAEQGFKGKIVMTSQTASQLNFKGKIRNPVILIDELASPLEPCLVDNKVTVLWGRSGHCMGGCWFKIEIDDEGVLYSGDYIEFSLSFACDPICDQNATLAIIDNAYGDSIQTPEQYRLELLELTKSMLKIGKNLLFPVPKYGRGLELIQLFAECLPDAPLSGDEHLRSQIRHIELIQDWLTPQAFNVLSKIKLGSLYKAFSKPGIIFVADPQLERPKSQALAQTAINRNSTIVITGYADMGTYSRRLLENKPAIFARYPVHMNDRETNRIISANEFEKSVNFHR